MRKKKHWFCTHVTQSNPAIVSGLKEPMSPNVNQLRRTFSPVSFSKNTYTLQSVHIVVCFLLGFIIKKIDIEHKHTFTQYSNGSSSKHATMYIIVGNSCGSIHKSEQCIMWTTGSGDTGRERRSFSLLLMR